MENSYLSKAATNGMKGYLCICILIHHLQQFSGVFSNTYFGHFLNRLGGWGVALFFFISGYGLFATYEKKGSEYLKHFFKNRLLPFYLTYYFFVVLYCIVMYKSVTLKVIIKSLTFGGTIVSFGWFFQYIGLFYIIFFFSFRFVDKKLGKLIFISLLVLFSIICYMTGQKYTAAIPFLIGMLFAINKSLLDKCMQSCWWAILILGLLAISGTYFCYIYSFIFARITFNPLIWELISTIGDIGVILFAISFSYATNKLPIIDNAVSRFISKFSLEIYAIQGIVLYELYFLCENKALYLILCFVITFILGILLHYLLYLMTRRIKGNKDYVI